MHSFEETRNINKTNFIEFNINNSIQACIHIAYRVAQKECNDFDP